MSNIDIGSASTLTPEYMGSEPGGFSLVCYGRHCIVPHVTAVPELFGRLSILWPARAKEFLPTAAFLPRVIGR